jgi:hypothetical protein
MILKSVCVLKQSHRRLTIGAQGDDYWKEILKRREEMRFQVQYLHLDWFARVS